LAALVLPWVAWRRGGVRHAVVAGAVLVLLCAPWAIRNTIRFDQPVLLTTSEGSVVAGANLPSTYRGPLIGGWDGAALANTRAGRDPGINEAAQSDRWRDEALDYAGDNTGRLPVVVAARVGRLWSVYPWSPRAKVDYAEGFHNRLRTVEYAAYPALLIVVALSIAGALALRRRAAPVWPLLAPLVLVTLVSALAFGDLRFRQAADVSLVVLAGVGVLALAERVAERRSHARA
jgi:hypothetical protein